MAAKSVLLPDDDLASRRWLIAAAFATALHGGLGLWLMNKHDVNLAGAPPAAIMIELAPLEVTPGPEMTQAEPEEVEPAQTITLPDLPPAPKPAVVLMTPPKVKPKPQPKKIVKQIPKPVVKRTRESPAPQTSAPPRAAEIRAASVAEAAAYRSAWSAGMNWSRHYPEAARARGEQGTVLLALTIGRSGHVMSARLIGSSGSATLDQAALEMARNASGRSLPPEMGSSVSLTVPVRYSIR